MTNHVAVYKLVVFGSDWDVYTYAFRDFICNPHCLYVIPFKGIGWRGYIQRILCNPRWNKIFPLRWKAMWTSYYTKSLQDKKYCFIIMENWLRLESNLQLLSRLRHTFKDSYIVCYLQDLLAHTIDQYTHRVVSADYLRNYSNLILSYDRNDSEKYNFQYAPTVYSPLEIKTIKPAESCDLYFLGSDKGRLDLLADICREMEKRSMKCLFYVLGVPKSKQIAQKGMYYPSHSITYEQNIRHIISAKCILETLQINARGETFRTWEAIMLNKKLVTNNPSVVDSPWYDQRYISVFKSTDDIDWNFIASDLPTWEENPYKNLITPRKLVQQIENQLHIHIFYE